MKIVLIPGLLCTKDIWAQTNKIRDIYSCYDADVNNFNSIEEMSNEILKTIPSDDISIIGISMGGYVAIETALKTGNRLKKLILINTTANSVNKATLSERERAIKLAEQGKMKEILEMSKGICYFKPKEEWLLLEKRMADEVGPETYIRQQRAIINRKNYFSLIKNISANTLIISGKADKVISYRDSIYMAEQIKNANLILLSECGHLSTLEKSDIVSECILKFLEL